MLPQECQKYFTSADAIAGAQACASANPSANNLCPKACVDWVTVSRSPSSLVCNSHSLVLAACRHQVTTALGWVPASSPVYSSVYSVPPPIDNCLGLGHGEWA